jgi:hypothetical protein
MTVCVDTASNMAVERPAGSHSLAAAAHCRRSPHRHRIHLVVLTKGCRDRWCCDRVVIV